MVGSLKVVRFVLPEFKNIYLSFSTIWVKVLSILDSIPKGFSLKLISKSYKILSLL